MHLTIKLFENNFYHHKSLCKLENMLENVLAIIFVNLSKTKSCPLQQILEIISTLKVNSILLNRVSFVRNTRPTIYSLYWKVTKYICKTTLLKVDITQQESKK